MQFLERSVVGLRSAVHELHSRNHRVRVLLIPMVHIADASFYAAVNDILRTCDNIVVEGVRSFRGRLLTLAYRIPARRKSLQLVLQSKAIHLDAIRARIIHGDVSGSEFAVSMSEIPMLQRIGLYLLAPVFGLALYAAGSRQIIGSGHSVDSLPHDNRSESGRALDEALLHARDRRLLERIEAHLLTESGKEQCTAVLYGGGHIPVVAATLMSRYGYRVHRSDWITAIAY